MLYVRARARVSIEKGEGGVFVVQREVNIYKTPALRGQRVRNEKPLCDRRQSLLPFVIVVMIMKFDYDG